MRIEILKRGFIPFLFALALLMAFTSAPIYPQIGPGPWTVEVIVDNVVYHHHPYPDGPQRETPKVVQGGTFIIRCKSAWTESEYDGAYTVTLSWANYDNHENENFTFVGASAYFTSGPHAGESTQADVTMAWAPSGSDTSYALSVKRPVDNKDNRDGDFNVDITMSASGAGGVPHIPTDNNATISYGSLMIMESAMRFTEVDPIHIQVLPPPNQPPRADFNFSPERPIVGEKVYFFDNSEDLDGYIVEWYWSYSLHFGDNYWTLPMPFGNGEQNPTLTFDHAGEAQITLKVTDDNGAIGRVSRIIQILAPVQVLISPTYQEGVPGATLTYTVTVTNNDNIQNTYLLMVSDNAGWPLALSENPLENVGPNENRMATLSVTIPENATSFDQDNIWVTATSVENAEVTDSEVCIAQVPGKAIFGLVNLSKISLDADLYLGQGSKLVVKFYTWGGDYQGGTVVWSGTTPDHVILLDNILHPLQPLVWVWVEKVVLVLTDAEGTTISTISTFIVRKIDLEIRFVKIVSEWFLAPPADRITLEIEFSAIPGKWFLAPS
ncbi:hypothetical protein ES703_24098 [subsurface metagenome]